jgi:phosphoglycerate dehydrogenase-like enzyme
MTNILVDVPLDQASLQQLQSLPAIRVAVAPPAKDPRPLPPEMLRDQDVLLCKHPPVNFDDLRSLQLMQLATAGYEHLKHLGMAGRPVRVCNARGIFDTAIGEWCVAMMVNLVRDFRGMIRHQEERTWARATRFQQEVRGRVVGVWGYGGIGRETARLAKAMGMTVRVMTRKGISPRVNTYSIPGTGDPDGVLPDQVFTILQEEDFLAGLDFLILALPHTRQSDGMIGERQLRRLQPGAFLLNPARGPIIQEQPLLRALREKWFAGAALDTHYAYPLPADHPLWSMPNVILTPHISGADKSEAYPARMGDLFQKNLTRWLEGEPLLNELTREEWLEA